MRHIDDVDDSKDKELDINESNFANTTNTSNNLRNVSKVKEPNKVSQELAFKEIHACLAREKLNRRFHINERKYANNFELPKPPLNFPHNGIAYYKNKPHLNSLTKLLINNTNDSQTRADNISERENTQDVYSKKTIRNIKQQEENSISLDIEANGIKIEEKIQKMEVKKLKGIS